MKVAFRVARVIALLCLVLLLVFVGSELAARFVGDRVYLRNDTQCSLLLMTEHDGEKVESGATILVKPSFMARTPSMMLVNSAGIWRGGIHFSLDKLSVRGEADRIISADWLEKELLGNRLTFAISQQGELSVAGPTYETGQLVAGMPLALGGDGRGPICD